MTYCAACGLECWPADPYWVEVDNVALCERCYDINCGIGVMGHVPTPEELKELFDATDRAAALRELKPPAGQ